MRHLAFAILILLTLSGVAQTSQPDNSIELYKVEKIETKNDWHIIYSTKNDSTYMIVSSIKAIIIDKGEKIEIGKSYSFHLTSLTIINGTESLPINYLDYDGIMLDDRTLIKVNPGKGIYDIYTSKNLIGLYFIE